MSYKLFHKLVKLLFQPLTPLMAISLLHSSLNSSITSLYLFVFVIVLPLKQVFFPGIFYLEIFRRSNHISVEAWLSLVKTSQMLFVTFCKTGSPFPFLDLPFVLIFLEEG